MNGWLPFSISATLLCALIFSFTYFFLYLRNKKTYLAVWSTAWLVDVIRLTFMLLSVLEGMRDYNAAFSTISLLASVTSSILLLFGWHVFLSKKYRQAWILLHAAISILLILSGFRIIPITWGFFIAFIYSGWMNI